MRTISLFVSAAMASVLAQTAIAQGPPPNPFVYLRGNYGVMPHHTTCVARDGFVRIGLQGEVAQPMDQDHIFMIPRGQHLSITDIHIADRNDGADPVTDSVVLYANGVQGEITLWFAGMVVPPKGVSTYDKALSTPIVLMGPTEFCYGAIGATAAHSPQVIVTGRLQ